MTFENEYQKILEQYYDPGRLQQIERLKHRLGKKPVIIFGAAWIGDYVYHLLCAWNIRPVCFADNFVTGCTMNGNGPVYSPEQALKKFPDSYVILALDKAKEQVRQQLLKTGVLPERVIHRNRILSQILTEKEFRCWKEGYQWAYEFFQDEVSKKIVLQRIRCYLLGAGMEKLGTCQYFEDSLFSLTEEEVFVDAGFYTGDTTEQFIRKTKGKYRKVFGFEPDPEVRRRIPGELKNERIEVVPAALYSSEENRMFASAFGGTTASGGTVVEGTDGQGENVQTVRTVSLDRFIAGQSPKLQPTFIKMDIEGAEKEALKGCREVIRRYQPRLAVCVYHRPEDIYELTRLIYEYNPKYRFTLRHYSDYCWETVLYAY